MVIKKYCDSEYHEVGSSLSPYSKSFKEKVQSMTAEQIILAMVDALTPPPVIEINMNTFGNTKTVEINPEKKFLWWVVQHRKTQEVCFGCAATNTICKISGKVFIPENIYSRKRRAAFIGADYKFLDCFECAIDSLRRGFVSNYNSYAEKGGFACIKYANLNYTLSMLGDNYTVADLKNYKLLASQQTEYPAIDKDILADKNH